MARHRIFTVGFELPGDEFLYVEFASRQTLLDADIILFKPALSCYDSYESHRGTPVLSESASFAAKEDLAHWRSEIAAAVNAGRLVIVYLSPPEQRYRYTGEKNYSGTGRSRVTTNLVGEISSYEAIPNIERVSATVGKEMIVEPSAVFFKSYWEEFGKDSRYEVTVSGKSLTALLKSRSGDRVVGAFLHGKIGTLLFLPPLPFDEEGATRYDEKFEKSVWKPHAVQFGKRVAASVGTMNEQLKSGRQSTPPPDWVNDSAYSIREEVNLRNQISGLSDRIAVLQKEKMDREDDLLQAGGLRRLLFEQGRPLEEAVREALKLLGFEVETIADGKSEFDAVLKCPEGRCIGEVEGKDNKAINIDKFSQLERNVHEDFAREEVTTHAKAVLFGNAQRLLPLIKRGDFFTEKCISAAQRINAALVRTPDLFAPGRYLKDHRDDVSYAKACRDSIFQANGAIVQFPPAK